MSAGFPGTCTGCGGPIAKGDDILWGRHDGDRNPSARHTVCPERPAEQAPAVVAPRRIAVENQGVYVLPGGAIVKVQANREKTRTYAKRWHEIGGTRLTELGERVNGEYEYEPGLVEIVAETGRKMTMEEAAAFILRYGTCARCGHALKDAKSVERGIGPVCVRYFRAE
jgi:hypothetical protein